MGLKLQIKKMTAYAEVGTGNELMGILVHLDIVPAGDGWKYNPFEIHIEDNKIYGRGVTDDKGPTIAVIHAIKRTYRRRSRLQKKSKNNFRYGLGIRQMGRY